MNIIYDREGVPVPSASSDVLNFYFLSQKASNILKKGVFFCFKSPTQISSKNQDQVLFFMTNNFFNSHPFYWIRKQLLRLPSINTIIK